MATSSTASDAAVPPLRFAFLPAGTLVGFKALPGWSATPLAQHYYVTEDFLNRQQTQRVGAAEETARVPQTEQHEMTPRVSEPREAHAPSASTTNHAGAASPSETGALHRLVDWSGIYSQLSVHNAVSYLSNQWERQEARAQLAALRYVGRAAPNQAETCAGMPSSPPDAPPPLRVLVCRDPRLADGSVSSKAKSDLMRAQLWDQRHALVEQLLAAHEQADGHEGEETCVARREELLQAFATVCATTHPTNAPPLVQTLGERLDAALLIADAADGECDGSGSSAADTQTGDRDAPRGSGVGYELMLPHCMMNHLRAEPLALFTAREDVPLLTGGLRHAIVAEAGTGAAVIAVNPCVCG